MSATSFPIGASKSELDTPALLVDLDTMEGNIKRIADMCRAFGVRWRPHMKGHKTPEIAHKELAAGAIGVTCAKLGEAEVMAAAGIRDILIANQIVGAKKIERLMDLIGPADPVVAVDGIHNITELSAIARRQRKELRVIIEVNIGMDRAGVEPGDAVADLAGVIARYANLRFVGVMGWESHAVNIANAADKQRAVAAAIERLSASAALCRAAGHNAEIVSCGGTGTFPYCIQQPGITEVQIGGGIFSDVHYRTHYHTDFPFALTILVTVISRPTPTRVVLDGGKKTMSGDAAMPQPLGLPAISMMRLSAEHMKIELETPSTTPCVGDRVELVVGYSDTTVNLHSNLIGIREGRVECVWPVAARGKLQ